MKKIMAALLALTLALSFAACGKKTETPAEPKDYAQIIVDVRADDYNEAYSVVAGATGETATLAHNPMNSSGDAAEGEIEMLTTVTGFDPALSSRYAFTTSIMNVKAYAVGIFMPADGQKDALMKNINEYVATQQKAFETYLPDQYENAKNAVVREVASGEIILVMDDNAAALADQIEAALKA